MTNREKYEACRSGWDAHEWGTREPWFFHDALDAMLRILLDLPATDPPPPPAIQVGDFVSERGTPYKVLSVRGDYVKCVSISGQTWEFPRASLTRIDAWSR